jgi:hypothetical protein
LKGFQGKEAAENVIKKCQELYKQFHNEINKGIDKKELVKLLNQKKH